MPGGLEFNDFSSDYLNNNKSTFRKAGDAFTVGSGNTINNSSTGGSSNSRGSAYDTWMSFMGNQSANTNSYNTQSNNQNAQTSASGSVQQPAMTEDAKSVKTPNTSGGAKLSKAQQEIYNQNLQIIANYNGKNGSNSTAIGAAYNADLMSGVNYDRAVRQNEKFDAGLATQNSLAAGNDHGSGDWKAPQEKSYYDYLETYDGPKSYQATVGAGQEAYEKYDKWVKDSRHYKKAWEGIDYKKVDDRAAYGLP